MEWSASGVWLAGKRLVIVQVEPIKINQAGWDLARTPGWHSDLSGGRKPPSQLAATTRECRLGQHRIACQLDDEDLSAFRQTLLSRATLVRYKLEQR